MNLDTYVNVRNQMNTGDLILFAGRSWLSRKIIKYAGGYSHVAMVLREKPYETVRFLMVHSYPRAGVVKVALSRFLQSYDGRVWWKPMNHGSMASIKQAYREIVQDTALSVMGQPYDWSGVLSYVLPWVKPDPDSFYCSEFVATVLSRLGLTDQEKMTPLEVSRMGCFLEATEL